MERSSIFGLLEKLWRTPVQEGRPGPLCWMIRARLCLPGQACAKAFREDQKWNFVPSAPRGEARGLLVFSGEKQTRRSNFGASRRRFTHLNTRHDARQDPDMALPAAISRDFWILVVRRDPLFAQLFANFRLARGAFQMAVSRARSIKNILVGPDGPCGPPEPSGPARMIFGMRWRNGAELVSQQRESFVAELFSDFPQNAKTKVFQFSQNRTKCSPRCTSAEHETRLPSSRARKPLGF